MSSDAKALAHERDVRDARTERHVGCTSGLLGNAVDHVRVRGCRDAGGLFLIWPALVRAVPARLARLRDGGSLPASGEMAADAHEHAHHLFGKVFAGRSRVVVDDVLLGNERCEVVEQRRFIVLHN